MFQIAARNYKISCFRCFKTHSCLTVSKHTCTYCIWVLFSMLQVTELATVKNPPERLRALQRWQRDGGVMIMGYEMYRNLSLCRRITDEVSKKEMKSVLVDPGTLTS